MPTSVLLAVLAAAGLLALAPALTRRHDAGERAVAYRLSSPARVLNRRRRRRTVPGRRPVNPPSWSVLEAARTGGMRSGVAFDGPSRDSAPRRGASRGGAGHTRVADPGRRVRTVRRPARRRPMPTALHRRRRVLVALIGLNLVEVAGALLVGPGFWIGFTVSFTVLLADLAYLRHRAVVTGRRRASVRRRLAWIAAEQAAVRQQQARRAAQRRAAVRQAAAERELSRRAAPQEYVEHYPVRDLGG